VNEEVALTVGYKEWEAVCEALGTGRQCVLLRKGGIHEGRAGFSFKHERFFLFPTRFHAQVEQVRVSRDAAAPGGEWAEGDEVPVRFWCEASRAGTLTSWEAVRQLEPYHVWGEDLVRERYDCGEIQQIHCALVRVFALPQPWVMPYEKHYGGCRTWVELLAPPENWERQLTPVLDDHEFATRQAAIEEILGAYPDSAIRRL